MTDSERIDGLQAQLIAYGMVLQLLLQEAPQETRDTVLRMAGPALERGLAMPLTDEQLEVIQSCLLSMGKSGS